MRLKDFEGRTFPLWKTFERLYYEPEAGTIYPDDIALILEVKEDSVAFRHTTSLIGLRVISSRGVVGWNNSSYFETIT